MTDLWWAIGVVGFVVVLGWWMIVWLAAELDNVETRLRELEDRVSDPKWPNA